MKSLVIILGLLLGIGAILLTNASESIVFFVLTGYIPVVNISVPPIIMLVFWAVIVPAIVIVYKSSSYGVWAIIEIVGRTNQRRINRRARWIGQRNLRHATLLNILVATLLYTADCLPKNSIFIPELAFRRRFMVVPVSV